MKAFLRITLLLIGVYALSPATPVSACSRRGPFIFSELFAADAIIRVTAARFVPDPDPSTKSDGVAPSTVEFAVEEILRGADVPRNVSLSGYLSDEDDYNETGVPYKFVRPGGRSGNCFADSYKKGTQYLLFLKKTANGYTSNISPLGPTNEQLSSETDPWLLWVKVRLNPCGKLYEGDAFYEKIRERGVSGVAWDKDPPSIKYRLAKCYLQRYESKDGPEDQYRKYLKRWVEKYERAEEER